MDWSDYYLKVSGGAGLGSEKGGISQKLYINFNVSLHATTLVVQINLWTKT